MESVPPINRFLKPGRPGLWLLWWRLKDSSLTGTTSNLARTPWCGYRNISSKHRDSSAIQYMDFTDFTVKNQDVT
jgi:hypothetical protein